MIRFYSSSRILIADLCPIYNNIPTNVIVNNYKQKLYEASSILILIGIRDTISIDIHTYLYLGMNMKLYEYTWSMFLRKKSIKSNLHT